MPAREIFEAWLLAEERVPLGELLRRHPDERAELEELARRDALAEGALGGLSPAHDSRASAGELLGRQLGDFRLLHELGRGGMGIVFEAEQLSLHRRVALKILPAQLTLNPRAFQRFQREAEVTARLRHPHIIDIHQMGAAEGIHFIVMERVEGSSLDVVLERMREESFGAQAPQTGDAVAVQRPEPEPRHVRPAPRVRRPSSVANKGHIEFAVRIVCQVADALEHAHAAGVIHRDIKPSNILLRANGEAVLTDFGLAREQGLPGITGTGEFAGTPNYVSPEQAMSGRVPLDHRTDVFSLGATLYELLTLRPPFSGRSAHETLAAILSKEPIPPARLNPALAPDLVTVVLKALEKDPDRRYPTARGLAEDLRAFVEYRPIRAKRASGVTRTLRWMRREPFKAALIGVLALGTPLGAWSFNTLRGSTRENLDLTHRLATAEIPARLQQAFLALGTGAGEQAEAGFREILGLSQPDEACTGLVMSLLMQKRPADALSAIDAFASGTRSSSALQRLRADALRVTGNEDQAAAIERDLPAPASPLERFLAAVRLLDDCPYALELSQLSYLPLSGLAPSLRDHSAPLRETDVRRRNAGLAEGAIAHLRLAARVDSDRAMYQFALAWAAWVAWDREEARDTAQAIEANWPGSPVARFYVGLAREVFDEGGALEAYTEALRLDANLRVAQERRAQLYLRGGDDPNAGREFERLYHGDPRNAAYPAGLGAALLATDPVKAERYCDEAIERDAGLTIAYRTKARAWYALGMLDKASETLRAALRVEPNDAILHNDLALVLSERDELEEAEAELEEARRLDPGLPFPACNQALVLRKLGERDERDGIRDSALDLYRAAEEHFGEALELAEERPELRFPVDRAVGARGETRMRMANLTREPEGRVRLEGQALEDARRAFAADPNFPYHALNLGVLTYRRRELTECVEPLTRALAHAWTKTEAKALDLQQPHAMLVHALEELGRLDEALSAARHWSEAFPEDAEAWNFRAYFQVSRAGGPADPDDALRSAQEAMALDGANYGVQDTYALALHWKGDHAQALEMGEQALAGARLGATPEDLSDIEAHVELIRAAQP